MLLFVPALTPRIAYTFELFFSTIVQADYQVCSDPEYFKSYTGIKFSYGKAPLADELFFAADGLLSEKNIVAKTTKGKMLFPVGSGALEFDPFAAAFFMTSRYEEYLPFEADKHGRFSAAQSIAQREGFLEQAVVHDWCYAVLAQIKARFPDFQYEENAYRFQPSFDIDNAFFLKGRSFLWKTKSIAKSLRSLRLKEASERISIAFANSKDPYDNYDWMEDLHQKSPAQYFFLIGNYGQEDTAVDLSYEPFRNIIRRFAERGGIHPSYRSNTQPELLEWEITQLQNSSGGLVTKSRQHYLKLRLPDTYRALVAAGIQEDWSMGYADAPGFRAGMAVSFYWYDLLKEEKSSLRIHPFMVMDQTLRQYLGLSPEAAAQKCLELIAECRRVKGSFCSLWHNESLSEQGVWKAWRNMYITLTTAAHSSENV